ncbi:MAG TPA: glycosyltransferase [Candidatus Didemnitutus sp.]|nr:glycosyltransferase [Candidatus Didemnitutus sp.]
MIYYDLTKMGAARQKSGLTRVSSRLLAEFGTGVTPVSWDEGFREFKKGGKIEFKASDWLLTVELFGEAERPGISDFLAQRPCRLAAIFHDAIPLRFPHITWPQSVQRHPGYMKLLAGFDRVFAISEASRRDLTGFWHWQGVTPRATVETIELGADFDGQERSVAAIAPGNGHRPSLLCIGIVEPRKNQSFLLDVAESLWRDGADFDLHVVGRVNPHYGESIEKRLKRVAKREPRLRFHAAASDTTLQRLYSEASVVMFPTVAEGCGLPLLEALWRGIPCVCSDLPVLRENADAGGCLAVHVNDLEAWRQATRAILADGPLREKLRREARERTLPRWADTAKALQAALV